MERCLLTAVRPENRKWQNKSTCTFLYTFVRNEIDAVTMENYRKTLQKHKKWKKERMLWSSNPISGCISKRNEITILKRYMPPLFCIITHNSMTWKQPKYLSMEEWIKRMWCINTVEYCSDFYRKEHPANMWQPWFPSS